jgi:TPR repeat protein
MKLLCCIVMLVGGSTGAVFAADTCPEIAAKFNAEMTALEEKNQKATAEDAATAFREAAAKWRATLRPNLMRADTMDADCWRIVAVMALDLKDQNLATHTREAFARLNVNDVPPESMADLDALVDQELLAKIPPEREKFVRTLGWIEKAGDQAKGVDLSDIADAYAEGVAQPKDDAAANDYFKRAVDKGSTHAMWRLGMRVRTGIGCERDRAAGLALLIRSAEGGDADGQLLAGRVLITGDDDEQDKARGESFLAKGAATGHADCAFTLAAYLRVGEVLPKDAKRALKLFEHVAESLPYAALAAATMHRAGEAGAVDHKAAARLYLAVAEGSDEELRSSAMIPLGDMMIRGEGFAKKDAEVGVNLLETAIQQVGGAGAILILADHYATGKFIPENPEKAFELWKKSHEDNADFEGTYLLSRAYKNGFGVEADEAEAVRLLKQAAEMGSDKARAELKALDTK